MGKIRVRIKAPFGEIVLEGDNAQEILETLRTMSTQFMSEISSLVSTKFAAPIKAQLEGIVELTTEGPVVTTREKLTHYEAIGLDHGGARRNNPREANSLRSHRTGLIRLRRKSQHRRPNQPTAQFERN